MKTLTLVTGNKFKLIEWRRIVPKDIQVEAVNLDIDEIQSLDLEKIAKAKAKSAYLLANKPIVVEDIAFEIDKLKGLPGPFVKFFQQQLGKEAMLQLAGASGVKAKAICVATLFDGKNYIVARGGVGGTIEVARGDEGFGFDFCFVPEGQSQTYAEMGAEQKDKISHRALAVKDLLRQL